MLSNPNQLSIHSLLTDVPTIKEYLGSGLFRGIGQKTASRIVDCFGKDTLVILDDDISRLAEVKGIASGRLAAIQSSWSESKSSPHRAAMSLLLGSRLSLNLSLKICEYYSEGALHVIKSNPYQLVEDLDGVGFKTADGIALALGIAPDADIRYAAGLLHSLRESTSEGHCYLPMNVLLENTIILLTTPSHIPSLPKLHFNLKQLLLNRTLMPGGLSESIYLAPFYRAEITVAGLVRSLAATVGASGSRARGKIAEIEDWLYGGAEASDKSLGLKEDLSEEQLTALAVAHNQRKIRQPSSTQLSMSPNNAGV